MHGELHAFDGGKSKHELRIQNIRSLRSGRCAHKLDEVGGVTRLPYALRIRPLFHYVASRFVEDSNM